MMGTATLEIEPYWMPGGGASLRLRGEFGLESAQEVRAALALLEVRAPPSLMLDLCDVDLLDSSGLRVIVEADRRARAGGRRFMVLAPRGTVPRRLLELTLLTELVAVLDEDDRLPPT